MADLRDVIEQLKANNKSEAGRDSTHTNEMRMSREANNQSFAELQEAITGTRSAIADQSDNLPSPSSLEETDKENANQTEKTNTLLQKIAGGIGGMLGNMKEKAKAVGKGFMSILKGTLFAGLFFALAKFFSSPLYQQMIDYIFKTLIPKLQFFYDSFFGEGGGFMKGFEALFSDDSGIGSIVLGLAGVTAIFAGVKMASMFKKLKGGVTSLLGFFKTASTEVGPLGGDTSKQKKGKDGLGKKGGGLGNFGKSISSAGRGVGGFISGILKGIASGLAAIAAPPVLIGLAAVSAAAIAIATAIRIMSPAFEPIGKMFESFGKTVREVFGGLGDFIKAIGKTIEGIIGSIGKAIGNVIDKITKMKTAGTEATTKQIKELSAIPGGLMLETAKGIDAIKAALDGFGGGTFGKIVGSLFGGKGPIEKIIELSKKVPELMKAAEAIAILGAAGSDFAKAEAEIERRKKVAELKERIGDGGKYGRFKRNTGNTLAEDQAELKALEGQAMPISAGGGSGFGPQSKNMITAAINAADITMIEKERMKREAEFKTASAGGGGPTNIVDARQSSTINTTGQSGNNNLTPNKLNGLTKGNAAG